MKRLLPYLAAAASGAAMAVALPLVVPWISLREIDPAGRLEIVAWVALVPALAALERARSVRGALALGLVSGLAFFFASIHWVSHAMTAFGGLSAGFSLFALSLLVLYMAAHWAGAFAMAWTLRRRLGWPLWAHLPLVWAAFEWLRNYLFTGFPWANLGYTQARHPRIAQLAAVLGVYAIAALVVLVNAVLAEALTAWRERRRAPVRSLAGTAALLVAVVVFGHVHLARARARMAAAPSIRVAIVQPNVNQDVKNEARENADYILGRLVPYTVEADRAGADLVAWPEAAYPRYVPRGIETFDLPGSGIPRLGRAHALLGASTLEWLREDGSRRPRLTNTSFLVAPDLRVLGRYTKHHLVPFGEYVPLARFLPFIKHVVPTLAPVSPGAELRVLSFSPVATEASASPGAPAVSVGATAAAAQDPIRLAPLICYDAIFPEIAGAFSREDPEPEILLNQTNDAWYGYSSGPYQFLAIVRMRAIETGKAIVRPAYAGVSAVIWPTGEVAPGALEVGPVDPERAPDPDERPRWLLADVPRLVGRTIYTRIGDAFAVSCALFAAAALVLALRARPAGGKATPKRWRRETR